MSAEPRLIRHISVHGRVQGVGFRAFVEHHALQRGLEGWVRNRRDGTVEAVFAGPKGTVEAMVKACGIGPLGARVDALYDRDGDADDLAPRRPAELFSVLATA